MNEKSGCLGLILRAIGIGPSPSDSGPLPFRLRDDFLSPAEISFYHVLMAAADSRFTVCPKVNLSDIFFVTRPDLNQAARNRISCKHVDFLLCDGRSMRPCAGIELDDSSHARKDRQARDAYVERVFETAGLPLLRFPARHSYAVSDIASRLAGCLGGSAASAPVPNPTDLAPSPTPLCPKCGIPLVLRHGAGGRGDFFGCANYPRCRATIAIPAPVVPCQAPTPGTPEADI